MIGMTRDEIKIVRNVLTKVFTTEVWIQRIHALCDMATRAINLEEDPPAYGMLIRRDRENFEHIAALRAQLEAETAAQHRQYEHAERAEAEAALRQEQLDMARGQRDEARRVAAKYRRGLEQIATGHVSGEPEHSAEASYIRASFACDALGLDSPTALQSAPPASDNQCDGCRRGLPVRGMTHFSGGVPLMRCTADRYTPASESGGGELLRERCTVCHGEARADCNGCQGTGYQDWSPSDDTTRATTGERRPIGTITTNSPGRLAELADPAPASEREDDAIVYEDVVDWADEIADASYDPDDIPDRDRKLAQAIMAHLHTKDMPDPAPADRPEPNFGWSECSVCGEFDCREHRDPRLLPCPFCASYAVIEPWHGGGPDQHRVGCNNPECPGDPSSSAETRDGAIAAWNARATDRQMAESAAASDRPEPDTHLSARINAGDSDRPEPGEHARFMGGEPEPEDRPEPSDKPPIGDIARALRRLWACANDEDYDTLRHAILELDGLRKRARHRSPEPSEALGEVEGLLLDAANFIADHDSNRASALYDLMCEGQAWGLICRIVRQATPARTSSRPGSTVP